MLAQLLTTLLVFATSAQAATELKPDHRVVSHYNTTTWCADINWENQCNTFIPQGASVLVNYCKDGDRNGKKPWEYSVVECTIGNLDIPGSHSALTGFVITMAGANMANGEVPTDPSC